MTQAADPSGTDSGAASDQVIRQLGEVLVQRRTAPADSSYVASLYAKGLNKILEKVGEEAVEVVLAARDCAEGQGTETQSANPTEVSQLQQALVGEVADLWFHTMVALTHQNIEPVAVLAELEKRFGVSGIEEKRNR